ncbi:MAG: MarR family transcriptional regulator [Clostridiales bacterium]|nr:MarR family transcriptional regulator [Clostridiales bacterium]
MNNEREFRTVRGYQILDAESKALTASMEDYLEMIYRTCGEEGYARVNRLAERLNVRPSSTTKVIKKLKDLGLVNYQKYGVIKLTEKGKALGSFLLKRHEVIEEFLKILGVEETRLKDTEMIEHDVSLSTLRGLYTLNRFLRETPDVMKQYEAFRIKLKGSDDFL